VQRTNCRQCPATLNSTEFRQFWISWKDGIVAYGNGNDPGLKVVGVYHDPTPITVNYMSIASYTGVVADWIIPGHLYNASAGGSVQYNTIKSYSAQSYNEQGRLCITKSVQ